MNKLFLLLALIIAPGLSHSQQKKNQTIWHLIIADKITRTGIERVTISINHISYFKTDLNGSIDIDKTVIKENDTLKFSSIGYNSCLIIINKNYNFPDTVLLTSSLTSLKEVRINSTKKGKIILGGLKNSYSKHWHPRINTEYAQYIPNTQKLSGIITNVTYVVNDALHGIEMPFRVALYSRNKADIFPNEELLKDSLIIYNPKRERRLNIDISKYNIEMPEDGVFVVFETLSSTHYTNKPIVYRNMEMYRIPGIDFDNDNDNAPMTIFDYSGIKNQPYSMCRIEKDQWIVSRVGINFAMDITVEPY